MIYNRIKEVIKNCFCAKKETSFDFDLYCEDLKRKIINYFECVENISEEEAAVIKYLENKDLCVFPYPFYEEQYKKNIEVLKDEQSGLLYVIHENKKLFFKRNMNKQQVENAYKFLLVEQDVNSPHRYLTDNFKVNKGDVVADIGAAEGIFSLSVIEDAEQIFIFETDKEWIEALNLTFTPWKNKVVIENKFVTNRNDEHCVSLDKYFENIKVAFIKVDVEGEELQIINGGRKILEIEKGLKFITCTYHRQNDAEMFSEILKKLNFKIEFSNGYMIFFYDKEIALPYLRRGLIRAVK